MKTPKPGSIVRLPVLFGAAFFATAFLSTDAFSADRISKCTVNLRRVSDGESLVFERTVYVRLDSETPVDLGLGKTTMTVKEERYSPDDYGFEVEPVSFPKGAYFRRDGAVFGTKRVYGSIECEDPKTVGFHYRDSSGKILLSDDGRGTIADVLENGGCVSGDLESAAKDLKRYWYLGIDGDVRVTGTGLEWNVRHQSCLVESEEIGERGVPSCREWSEPTFTKGSAAECRD